MHAAELIADLLARGHAAEFRVHGDSMDPVIRAEDLLHVEPPGDFAIGDVILTHTARGLTAHRVIARNGDVVITRGDNAPANDDAVETSRVIGVVTYILRDGKRLSVRAEWWPLRMLRRWRRSQPD